MQQIMNWQEQCTHAQVDVTAQAVVKRKVLTVLVDVATALQVATAVDQLLTFKPASIIDM
jgi:hypothetical protein